MELNLSPELPQRLLAWYAQSHRDLPWRRDREPYHIWLSEIMLQQTRVEAVRGYYARFLQQFPDISALAQAPEEQLLKLWEGLGYYSRVRNLQKAAKILVEEYGGAFPDDLARLRALPGIGDYTAGAIASICFERPTPAVDGNVLRVVSRLTACSEPITAIPTKRAVTAALAAVYPQEGCGLFTQSLMELGAMVCLPNGVPKCTLCPVRTLCEACRSGRQQSLPVRGEKRARRQEQRSVLILQSDGRLALTRRPTRGLLAGLWQLPDAEGELSEQQAIDLAEQWGVHVRHLLKTVEKTHIFTHVQWNMKGFYLSCTGQPAQFIWATREELAEKYALPTAFRQFLD